MQHLSFKNAFCIKTYNATLKNIAEHVSRLDWAMEEYNVGGTKLTTPTDPEK
jgi:hypothetical protein